MDENFSQEAKAIISESRKIAISLGNDFISTYHFLLADCKLNDKYSIRQFAFESEEEYETFLNGLKVVNSEDVYDRIPLTQEAEQTIRKSFELWTRFHDNQIFPYHLFLAASQLHKSFFCSVFEQKKDFIRG